MIIIISMYYDNPKKSLIQITHQEFLFFVRFKKSYLIALLWLHWYKYQKLFLKHILDLDNYDISMISLSIFVWIHWHYHLQKLQFVKYHWNYRKKTHKFHYEMMINNTMLNYYTHMFGIPGANFHYHFPLVFPIRK